MTEGQSAAARPAGSRNQLSKAFHILSVMAESGATDLGVREISALVPMATSTVHRLLGDLAELGLVWVEPGGRYALGIEMRRLAGLATADSWPEAVARQRLVTLHEQARGMVLVTYYDAGRAQVMHSEAVGGPLPVRFLMPAYRWLPAHIGAPALAILAFRPEGEQLAVSSAPAHTDTDHDVRPGESPIDLRDVLATIRCRGYATSHGPAVSGASVVAVPITEPMAAPRASLAVVQPAATRGESDCEELAGLLQATAASIGHELARHGGLARLL